MKYNYIRQWFEFYNQHLAIMQQPVAQLDDVNLATSCCQISEDVFKVFYVKRIKNDNYGR